jgi:hypothetical protein
MDGNERMTWGINCDTISRGKALVKGKQDVILEKRFRRVSDPTRVNEQASG